MLFQNVSVASLTVALDHGAPGLYCVLAYDKRGRGTVLGRVVRHL